MSKRKQDDLYRFVESKIICGGYGNGERLPSLRRLAERFAISLPTARRVLAHLAERGLVDLRRGSGCYVSEHSRPKNDGPIAVVSAPFSEGRELNLTGIAISGVAARLQELGLNMRHYSYHAKDFNDAILDSISRKSNGVILLGGYDAVLRKPRPRTPMVGLVMHNSYDGIFSVIDLDPVRSAELAAEFFRTRARKRITIIVPDRLNYAFRELVFRSLWTRTGEECETISGPVREFQPGRGYLYVFGVSAYRDAVAYNQQTGRILAEDCTVLCMDGRPMFNYDSVSAMPTVALNWRQAGIAAADELFRRLSRPGSAARRIYMNTELYLDQRP